MAISYPLLAEKREEILHLAQQYGAKRVRVFGSVVHGTATEQSDIDFLVAFDPDRSLLDLVGLKQDLRDLLGREVEVISKGGLSPYLKDRILQEAQPL